MGLYKHDNIFPALLITQLLILNPNQVPSNTEPQQPQHYVSKIRPLSSRGGGVEALT